MPRVKKEYGSGPSIEELFGEEKPKKKRGRKPSTKRARKAKVETPAAAAPAAVEEAHVNPVPVEQRTWAHEGINFK